MFDQRSTNTKTEFVRMQGAAMQKSYGRKDLIPLFLADMDFDVAPVIQQALAERLKTPNFAYELLLPETVQAICDWHNNQHGWTINPQHLLFATGVLAAIVTCLEAYTEEGDGILFNTPAYPMFFNIIKGCNRDVVTCDLQETDGYWNIDFAALEDKLSQAHVKVFIFCNPHNPLGRIWTEEEMLRIDELCARHNVLIISDEIHADMAYNGHQHKPFATLNNYKAQLISVGAPTKVFNLASIGNAFIVIDDKELRNKISTQLNRSHTNKPNAFCNVAVEAAYTQGAEWRQELVAYLEDNARYIQDFIATHIPGVKVAPCETGFLLWLDFSGRFDNAEKLRDFLCNEAKWATSDGATFGRGYELCARITISSPRSVMQQAMQQLADALKPHAV